MLEFVKQPWPWYIGGGLIGLIVPSLLIIGNKYFGISANLRHACAALFPGNLKFFQYDWKKESWNLFFVAGILLGAIIATLFLSNPAPMHVHPALVSELKTYGLTTFTRQLPPEIFSFQSLFTPRGFILLVVGGFLVGFGTRYAGGCTSGHAIMGLSTLQIPSLIATLSFMAGGLVMANWILPFIMRLK